MNPSSARDFIQANTRVTHAPLVPEISLHLATQITPIWQATETYLAENGIDPPFWAFAWPGSQLIARHILDNPTLVAGKRVLDFASGCGLAAIAAIKAGAHTASVNDIDPIAMEAAALNATLNHTILDYRPGNLVGTVSDWDLIVCGDVCYEAPMTNAIFPWLQSCACTTEVWIADPGRSYRPNHDLIPITRRTIETTRELEDQDRRVTTLYRLTA